MKLSLVICTYRRPGPVRRLLEAVAVQTRRPDEVLVVDASPDQETEEDLRVELHSLSGVADAFSHPIDD